MATSSTATTLMPLLIHLLRGASDLASVAATHAKVLKVGTASTVASSNHLLAAYCRCGATARARYLFDEMRDRDVVSWTALMSRYASAGQPRVVIALLRAMCRVGVPSNTFTFSTAASACARLADAGLGRQVHAHAEVAGYACDPVVTTALVNMYGKAGGVEDAHAVFEIKGIPYVFYVGVVSPAGARAGEVMMLLDELEGREKGYKERLGSARVFDAHEEDGEEGKGVMVGVHSEMLALGFGLLVILRGMTIRVLKNLRICCNCHDAFKIISGIVEREFVVRDLNRFHHFKMGHVLAMTTGDSRNQGYNQSSSEFSK